MGGPRSETIKQADALFKDMPAVPVRPAVDSNLIKLHGVARGADFPLEMMGEGQGNLGGVGILGEKAHHD
jgi:hypothetical protein